MKRLVSGLLLATTLGGAVLSTAAPASAHEYDYGRRSSNSAVIGIGAGLLGLAIGSSLAQNRSYSTPRYYSQPSYYSQQSYYGQSYYAPRSHYFTPAYGYGYAQPSYEYNDEYSGYDYAPAYGYQRPGVNLSLSFGSPDY